MAEVKKFSASEVSHHTTKNDCWVIIHGKVYDVTKFLDDHPGGDDALLNASASGDASEDFDIVGHSSSAEAMMNNYLIGSVDGGSGAASGVASRADSNSGKTNKPAVPPPTSSFNPLPLLVIALAVAAWYYLTFISKNKE